MLTGIFAKTFAVTGAGPVLHAVRAAGYGMAQFNFACLGLPPMPADIPAALSHSIAEAARATGVPIAAVSGTYNMIHPDVNQRAEGLRRLQTMIEAAPAMGTRLVTLCTGTRDPDDQWRHHPDNTTPMAWRDLIAALEPALTTAEAHGVDLGVEPELANVVSSPELAQRLIAELRSPRLKIVLDPANLFERARAPDIASIVERAIDLLADHMVMTHAKDRRADGSFCAAGTGVIDFGHFVGRLHKAGIKCVLMTHGLSEQEAPGVAAFLRRTIDESTAT